MNETVDDAGVLTVGVVGHWQVDGHVTLDSFGSVKWDETSGRSWQLIDE